MGERLAVLIAALLLALATVASAADPPAAASLRIVVVDGSTEAPLPLSSVDVYGGRSLHGGTGADGATAFDGLPAGTYELEVRKSGYVSRTLRGVMVDAAHAQVTVRLQRLPAERPSWLRTIGRVTSKPKPKISSTDVSADTPEARLTGSVLRSAETLPGVVFERGGLADQLSIDGHPASQTQVSFEGAPVSARGYALNLSGFDLDLFETVSVNPSSASGAPGGTLNFGARDPALDWIGSGAVVAGSFGENGESLTERGTSGRLGVSFAHARRDAVSPLNGLEFLDTSGLRYAHDAAVRTSGDALKLRYPLSPENVLVATALSIRSHAPFMCDAEAGAVPCGYGPRNVQDSSVAALQLRDYVVTGRLSGSFALYASHLGVAVDQSGHYVAGIGLPSTSVQSIRTSGVLANAEVQIGRGYPLTLTADLHRDSVSSSGSAFGSIFPPADAGHSFGSFTVGGPVLNGRRVGANATLAAQQEDGAAQSAFGLSAHYSIGNDDKLAGEMSFGGLVPSGVASGALSPVASLAYDCANGNAVGYGPSQRGTDGRAVKSRLTWSHVGSRVLSLVTVRHEVDRDVPLTALVGAFGLDPGLFGNGYFAQAQTVFGAACGVAPARLAPSNLFYRVEAVAPRVVYDGAQATLRSALGRNTVVEASYALNTVRAFGSTGPLFSPYSTVIAGAQVPNQPIQTWNVALTSHLDRRGTTALANVLHVGANNPNGLPGYTLLDVGFEVPLHDRGRLNVSVLNAGGVHGAAFASPADSFPLATAAGPFQPIPHELRPRSLEISLRIPFGFGADLQDVRAIDPGPEAYGYRLVPYPDRRPDDAFAIDRKSGRCGPEIAKQGAHALNVVRAYAADVEAARRSAGSYPAVFPARTVDGLHMSYRRNGSSFALIIGPDKNLPWTERVPIVKPLVGCATLYSGFLPETRRRGLYIPSHDEQLELAPVFEYAPEVGLYVPPPLIENARFFPVYAKLPPEPPADPFAISIGDACSASVRPAAEAFVALVKPYAHAVFAGGAEPNAPPGLRIVSHPGKTGPSWLEIASDDLDVKSLSGCLRIAAASTDQLAALGLGGTNAPTLDFAPRVGFYNAW